MMGVQMWKKRPVKPYKCRKHGVVPESEMTIWVDPKNDMIYRYCKICKRNDYEKRRYKVIQQRIEAGLPVQGARAKAVLAAAKSLSADVPVPGEKVKGQPELKNFPTAMQEAMRKAMEIQNRPALDLLTSEKPLPKPSAPLPPPPVPPKEAQPCKRVKKPYKFSFKTRFKRFLKKLVHKLTVW